MASETIMGPIDHRREIVSAAGARIRIDHLQKQSIP
jgi:hypothetical protein